MTTSSGMTRSKVCIKCGVDKLVDAYGRDSRTDDGFGRTCRDCRGGKGKRSGGGKAVRPRDPKPEMAPPPVKLNGHLEVAAGLGFRASFEPGVFEIEQDRSDGDETYTHTITLAAHEARQLVDWLEAKVSEVAA